MSGRTVSRRDLLRGGRDAGGLLALSTVLQRTVDLDAAQAPPRAPAPDVYGSIGVRPVINARGTFTIISGSLMLPEVRAAMDAASRHYVHLDELAEAIGRRLAALTGAEWGLVTSGCSAALTHATAACIAGGNPDLHIRIPNLSGFPKDEVIIPRHSRNVYDAAVRAVGARIVEVDSLADLEAALGPRTAMVYVMAGPRVDASPLTVKTIAQAVASRRVPILVDAAAEILTMPNVHLRDGAALVGYSGGKCIRGPQTAGLLLGRRDLVRAAWVHSAPHHGPGRALKVGKEEAIGMLTAVERWFTRDHDGEWKAWTAMLDHIARRLAGLDGVTTSVVQPAGLSNRTPALRVLWDPHRFALTGDEMSRTLFESEPRIALSATRSGALTGVTVTPYMMSPGDEAVIAERLSALLANARPAAAPSGPAPAAVDLSGRWDVRIEYAAGVSTHGWFLRQRGNDIDGVHQGEFITRDVTGTIDGDSVRLRSAFGEEHGDAITLVFTGKAADGRMGGALDMGEYLAAQWTAVRHTRA